MNGPPFGRKTTSETQRKHPRFRTKPLHDVALKIKEKHSYLRLANISLGGIGIFVEGIEDLPKEFSATLELGKVSFEVDIQKVFQNEELAGCQFKDPPLALQKAIEKYFETEILASKLNRVDTRPALNNGQDKVLFFHGQNNCELLINERNGKVCYFSVVILGNCIEVDPKGTLMTGERIEDQKAPVRNGIYLFKPLGKPGQHVFDQAVRFIDSIESLPADYRKNLIEIMTESAKKIRA